MKKYKITNMDVTCTVNGCQDCTCNYIKTESEDNEIQNV